MLVSTPPSAHAPAPIPPDTPARPDYLHDGRTLKSWLLTTDHKRIGLLYLGSLTLFFLIGGITAMLIRLELLTPAGDLFSSDTYNRLFTIHGIVMIFLFLVPSIPNTLGNFLIPLMIGARDLAFPRLNLASWYVFNLGAVIVLGAVVLGGVDTGWTFYPPFSTDFSSSRVFLVVVGIFFVGFSSIMTGLNFIVTTHTMRAPGLTWLRLPLFVWTIYATSLILMLSTPVLTLTLLMVAVERVAGVGIFDPALGGDPILFQHFFWFYSHPVVYIMLLPGMGVVSEVITCFSRKRLFGYVWVVVATLGIAVFSFLVWGHHMFVSGQSIYAGLAFSLLSYLVAVPSAVKVFNWTATLYKGRIYLKTPMLYVLGFIWLFTIGGLTGIMQAAIPIDVHVHDTYFIVAHFHFIMVGGTMLAYLGGLHFWWPKMTGRLYPERLGVFAAIVSFVGFNLTFVPQFIMGYLGMPRRYHQYPPEFEIYHVLSTAGASILAVGFLLPAFYLLWSLRYGARAPANPWGATGLEWRTPSPPPKQNFEVKPVVTEEAYAYETG